MSASVAEPMSRNQPDPQTSRRAQKPRDAASIAIIDRSAESPRVLMGRRSQRHVFMPGVYVFPGGRCDPADRHLGVCTPLHPLEQAKLQSALRQNVRPAHLQALAVAAIREAYEETGLTIGETDPDHPLGFRPDLAKLRFIARAVTPPRLVRRFDTRFFSLFADDVNLDFKQIRSSPELEELDWVDMARTEHLPMADITRTILSDLADQLNSDQSLPFGMPVPYYTAPHGRFVRRMLQGN